MAKKIEVFQNEYEYLKQTAAENALALAVLQAERDNLRNELDEIKKEYAELAYRADCYRCAHAVQVEEANQCEQANFECDRCTAECPCCNCVAGSHYERQKPETEENR